MVMAVRCVRAGKRTKAPAAPTLVPVRHKLVMHVLSDSARASTRHPASHLKLPFHFISSFVRAGSLELMRCSSCGGRSGCAVALLPKAKASAGEPKREELRTELIGWLGFATGSAAGGAAEDTPKGLVKAAVPKGAFVGAPPKTGAAPGAA